MNQLRQFGLIRRVSQMASRRCALWVLVLLSGVCGGAGIIASPTPAANPVAPHMDFSSSNGPGAPDTLATFPMANSNQQSAAQMAVSVPAVMPTNTPAASSNASAAAIDPLKKQLETARYLRKTRQFKSAKKLLLALLADTSPDAIQRSALLELAAMARDQNELSRAEDIYAQFLDRWPNDPRIPEILLRQGLIFRQMGLSDMALNKFYAVMTTALTLKSGQFDLYQQLVLQAQIEIADTHYDLGKYAEAAEFYSRLFKQDNPGIDKRMILYKLVCCYSYTSNYDQAIANGRDFLAHYPGSTEEPEVRFDVAQALNQLGHHNDALLQVLELLREQSGQAKAHPDTWAYWRQRAGNLIGNQLFQEGDYPRALDIYTSLAELDPSPQWQLPVWYQMGLTYEHLWQPQKATHMYKQIINQEQQLGTNAPPSLEALANMAQWRVNFIQWQGHAQNVNRDLHQLNQAIADLQPATSSLP